LSVPQADKSLIICVAAFLAKETHQKLYHLKPTQFHHLLEA